MNDKNYPKWLDHCVFYEIYPQSFKDSNADGIGDFQGIISKLDYIVELGCNAIWLNPCFESPFGDAGYDVSNYYKTAPRYGTNEDLKQLFDEIHKRDMHILLDLVPGHTSVEHEWFRQSKKAGRNEYTDRYVWTDSIWKEPVGYASLRGISERDGSCMVNFFSNQPALNYGYYRPDPNEPWQQSIQDAGPQGTISAIIDIMRFWLQMGCDGFRVDMAGSLVKGDEDGKGTIEVWIQIRKFLDDEFPDAAMVSEWGEPEQSLQGGFHMDFLLHFGSSHYNDLFRCEKPFFAGKGDVSEFAKKYIESYRKSAHKGLICIPSGNHDMERLSHRVQGDKLKIAFGFLLTMPGVPFIYYGDEIGMRYLEGLTSVEGGYGRTGSRSPMQWDHSLNAGFGNSPKDMLYIRQDESCGKPTVVDQINDKDSLWNEIKRLIALRKKHTALQSWGEIEIIYAEKNLYPFAYMRYDDSEKLLVVLNPSDKKAHLHATYEVKETSYSFGRKMSIKSGIMILEANSFGIYKL
ncbi:MAG: glycosylase [Oscillospiraceae bacterium]|nr:glycosylase [Oscillospiraceae bacterium]